MLKGRLLVWLFLAASALAVAAPAVQAQGGVVSRTLSNGMEVFVKPDHRAPVVTSMVWYRVGGLDEIRGQTGISHVLEHMMFKGTKEVGPGELSEIIARNGGQENAFTGQDYTAYFEQLAADRLEVGLRLEADRMVNLKLLKKEFKKEVQVVMEERRLRVEDNPQALAQETLTSVAFDASGYGDPVIGWMPDLKDLTLAQTRSWYEEYYSPRNARLVVVGDVKPAQVFDLAEKYFGGFERGEDPRRKPSYNPDISGRRSVDLTERARVPYLIAGYHAPNLPAADKPWEPFALRVLAGVLDEGRSSRFSADLVRNQRVAAAAGVYYDPESREPGLFYLEGTPSSDASLQDLESALLEQVGTLRKKLVPADELERVKRQIEAAEVFQRDSVFYQAMQIGKLETIGYGHEYLNTYLDRIRAVTPEQVRAVARKYLQPNRRTIVRLHPEQRQSAESES
ncbi:M16 family metallopeptidase [Thiohalorhabdus sp. Cl-TMA]|uniref:M16 family metallopeptidase n=1 Tax=Thiohalorhabdus methylotrophus TaxID=3242694 RepID=A0ABV4TVN5_9GAMM